MNSSAQVVRSWRFWLESLWKMNSLPQSSKVGDFDWKVCEKWTACLSLQKLEILTGKSVKNEQLASVFKSWRFWLESLWKMNSLPQVFKSWNFDWKVCEKWTTSLRSSEVGDFWLESLWKMNNSPQVFKSWRFWLESLKNEQLTSGFQKLENFDWMVCEKWITCLRFSKVAEFWLESLWKIQFNCGPWNFANFDISCQTEDTVMPQICRTNN